MRDVAEAVGVRTPSLYKRVRGRADLFRLILEDVADELSSVADAAAASGDPATDLRALLTGYRAFVHANPAAYALTYTPRQPDGGATARSERSSAVLLRVVAELAGPEQTLPSARTVVAWANGFITMELAGAFRLGGDVERAWDFGLDRLLDAVRPVPDSGPGSGPGSVTGRRRNGTGA
ncbi:TetR-like C-terminal domain-containing protein [Actinacidiphila alni]|uniref:TetR-like C-terminal domain-containing protein n=1 Tax=Actinacidiphila alni TaxID=380248 RepID=UPI0033F45A88